MDKTNQFYEAWHWLDEHPIYQEDDMGTSWFQESLHIMVQKVNPVTGEVDINNPSLNSVVEVWLESGGFANDEGFKHTYHDLDLDCGGNTFEEAIINLAAQVKAKYGDSNTVREGFKSIYD